MSAELLTCFTPHKLECSAVEVPPDHRRRLLHLLGASRQPRLGTKHVGYIDYAFGENRIDIRFVEPPELTNHDLDDFPAAYKH